MKLSSFVLVIELFTLYALFTCLAETKIDDELVQQILNDPQLSDLLDDPDSLMAMLKAKLLSPSKPVKKCYVAVNKPYTIIKTKESQRAGAVFLSATTVESPQTCYDTCCANYSCNTAIMKQNGDDKTSCYLFDCGNPSVCIFSTNSVFSTVQLSRINQHYSKGDYVSDEEDSSTMSTVTVTSTTVTSTTLSPSVPPSIDSHIHKVNEFPSDVCKADVDCTGDSNVVCSDSGFCVCRIGYHAVGAHCRSDCNHYQFECNNTDRPMVSECIQLWDLCDGVTQCSDGSDEAYCPGQKKGVDEHAVSTPVKLQPTSTIMSTTISNHSSESSVYAQTQNSEGGKMQEGTKGAVIALSFGVTLTAILIFFAACHFCRGNNRPWKVRRFHVDGESDYLVNGMYL